MTAFLIAFLYVAGARLWIECSSLHVPHMPKGMRYWMAAFWPLVELLVVANDARVALIHYVAKHSDPKP